ncbi:DNA repair protein [Helicobacter mehlei]|uniref:DNA repair protein RecN n=1 Tax=Helicobacter mehlei TaxID=2316080 RepID=A0A553UU92_9HELI|nr:DNA repair protein [Helicobacter mehlei]TSA83778.1 DNA repair protein [Helicobacter mehlei]
MIESVEIKKGLVFAHACLEFSPHLNVISGASGSGKSVLIDCVLASLGLQEVRAQSITTLYKDNNHTRHLQAFKDKKTKRTLDHKPTTKKALQDRFAPLVLHISSHKHAQELTPSFLLELLDGYIDPQLTHTFQETHQAYTQARQELAKQQQEATHLDMLKEMARFELAQLQSVDLQEGSYTHLLELKKAYSSKEKMASQIKAGLEALEHSFEITKALQYTPTPKEPLEALLEEAKQALSDRLCQLEELEEMDIQDLLDKTNKLGAILKKYGSEAQARARKETLSADYERYCAHAHNLEKLQQQAQDLEQECLKLALEIKQERLKYLPSMQENLESYTQQLLLKKPALSLQATPLGTKGLESLEITLGNAPLAHVSAGEFNRLRLALLALKASLKKQVLDCPAQTIIVDELDTNLSGRESASVALILKELSAIYQIIAISHAPHLPAIADRHFLVHQEGSLTSVKPLNKDEQTLEIARMVDANLGKEALAYAKRMLEPK